MRGFFADPLDRGTDMGPLSSAAAREQVAAQVADALAHGATARVGGTVFSSDHERAWRVAGQLETGMVWINSEPKSTIDGPFGGVKRSGTGRELGRFGLEEFSSRKMIRRLADT